ncbi:MAG: penicillin-binding protein 2 [Henriciella sp.]
MSKSRPVDELFSRRAAIAAGAGGVMFSGLIARLFQLQILEGKKYQEVARENGIRAILAPPLRGSILDRFGRPLASHRQAGRVSVVREQTPNLIDTLNELGRYIQLSDERKTRILRDARRQASFLPVIVRSELSYEDFAKLSVRAPNIPGVVVEMAKTRSYPRGRDFAHVLGYVAKASQVDLTRLTEGMASDESDAIKRLFRHPDMRTGRSGVERYAEEWLRGEPGWRRVESNAAGRIIRELPSDDTAPKPGRDLYLTVDAELQKVAIDRFGEESGAAVVMDIESGDILAFVSTPAFDPNDFVNGISQADYDLLRFNDRSPLYHKAFDGTYPPGSTYKMVVAAAALEAGVVNPSERIYCDKTYRFGNRTWHCWKNGGHGSVNMHSAIKGSCDVYFYEIARRTGVEKIADMSRRFGFGQAWDIGIPASSRRAGVVPDDPWKRRVHGEQWYEGETLNFGIGQGYLNASPLQLAIMSARIAAEGRLITPRIIGDGPRPEADIPDDAPLDAAIMQRMKAGMFGVTSEGGGTAYRSGDLGLGGPRLAGKTGTAQVRRISAAERASGILKGENIDRKLRDHALFVAYAPADDPKYAISVIVEHGEGGSSTAAPIARDIMAAAIRMNSARTPAYQKTASVTGKGLSTGAP